MRTKIAHRKQLPIILPPQQQRNPQQHRLRRLPRAQLAPPASPDTNPQRSAPSEAPKPHSPCRTSSFISQPESTTTAPHTLNTCLTLVRQTRLLDTAATASSSSSSGSLFYASFTLFTPPLLDDADSVHAEVAREMLLRHDWTSPSTPTASATSRKPRSSTGPWPPASASSAVHTATARLPLAFTVLALALIVEAFARRAFPAPPRRPLRRPHPPLQLRHLHLHPHHHPRRHRLPLAHPRPLLLLAHRTIDHHKVGCPIIARLIALSRGRTTPHATNPLLCWAFAACCALNVLTKGLIGIVFPIAHRPHPPRSSPAASAPPSPASANSTHLQHHRLPRHRRPLAHPHRPRQPHPRPPRQPHLHQPPLASPAPHRRQRPRLALVLLRQRAPPPLPQPPRPPRLRHRPPLSLLGTPPHLDHALVSAYPPPRPRAAIPCPHKHLRANPRLPSAPSLPEESTRLLLGLWAAIPLLFFSLSTRQEYYVLPALPPLILLIAAWLNDEATEAESFTVPNPLTRAGQRISVVLLVLGSLAALIAGFFVLHAHPPGTQHRSRHPPPPEPRRLRSLLRPLPRPQRPGHVRLPHPTPPHRHRPLRRHPRQLARSARNYKPHAANLALAAATFVFLLAAHIGLQIFSPVLTSRQLAAAIDPVLKPDRPHRHPRRVRSRQHPRLLPPPPRPQRRTHPHPRTAAAPTSGTAASSPTPHPSSRTPSPSASSGPAPPHLPLAGPHRPRPPPPRQDLLHRPVRRQRDRQQPTQSLLTRTRESYQYSGAFRRLPLSTQKSCTICFCFLRLQVFFAISAQKSHVKPPNPTKTS